MKSSDCIPGNIYVVLYGTLHEKKLIVTWPEKYNSNFRVPIINAYGDYVEKSDFGYHEAEGNILREATLEEKNELFTKSGKQINYDIF